MITLPVFRVFDGRRCASRVLVATVLLTVLLGCSRTADRKQPRLVLLYATCTVNCDFLEPYNNDVGYTPKLAEFAKSGVVFQRHMSEAGQSGIAYASLVSGEQAYQHGVYYHPGKLSDDLYLITEAFADAGYESFYWNGHIMADINLNFGQGISPQNRILVPPVFKRSILQSGDERFQELLKRLKEDPDYRAFVLVTFSRTHAPYHKQFPIEFYEAISESFPREFEGLSMADAENYWAIYEKDRRKFECDLDATARTRGLSDADVSTMAQVLEWTYKADIIGLDFMFGRTLTLLEENDLLDHSLIAFTADHGETLYRTNTLLNWSHGFQLSPEVLRVPWILYSPMHKLRAGGYEGVTRSIDVFPTLAGLCGIDLSQHELEGVDLSPTLLGEAKPPHLVAFYHTSAVHAELHLPDFLRSETLKRYFGSADVSVIWVGSRDEDTTYKLRNLDGENWGMQVFDVSQDPEESTDLFDSENPIHIRMKEALEDYKSLLVSRYGKTDNPDVPYEDAMRRLQSLGYVGGN
jgi:arylsulfatase A-like enzyme